MTKQWLERSTSVFDQWKILYRRKTTFANLYKWVLYSYVKPLQQCGQRQIANHTDYSCPLTELKGGLFCLCLYLSVCLSLSLSLSVSLSSRGGRWCDPRVGVHGDSVYQSINQSYNFNAPISINKNPESGAPVRYATFFNVRQCQTDESLAGPWRSRNCQRIWQSSEESFRCAARSDWNVVRR